MKHLMRSVLVVGAVTLLATQVGAQTAPPIRNGQVEIFGALPRTTSGEVNVAALEQTITTQFARPGVQEVQFRNVSLTEAEQRALFLDSDPNKNLLLQVSDVVPSPNGAERNVTFRGDDFRARVGREEGQLRARVEGVDLSQLSDQERQNLQAQFDRLRLEGANDRGGNQDGNRGGHGRGDNSGPGSLHSGSRGGDHGGRGGRDDHRMGRDGDVRQEDRRADRREDRQVDRREDRREDRQMDRREDRGEDRRANSGGEHRGLDRADRVAGEHGREGRDEARMAQMDRPDRPERHEQPDGSER